MVYAYDPRVKYLSGPAVRRRLLQRYGLGDAIPTQDSSLPDTLTPPTFTDPPIVNPSPGTVYSLPPIPTQDSPLPGSLTPPTNTYKPPAGLPIISATGQVNAAALLAPAVPAVSFWNQQLIRGVSNTVLVAGVGGIMALAMIGGGKRRRR